MANTNENMKVFVRSKNVPVAIRVVEDLQWTTAGTFKVRRTMLQYENQLDEGQMAILEYARKLAGAAGVSLEVVDLSRLNFISRFVKYLFAKTPRVPSVEIPGMVLSDLLAAQTPEPAIRKLYSSHELVFSRALQKR